MEPTPHSNPGTTPHTQPIPAGAAEQPTMPPHGVTAHVPEHVAIGIRDALKDLVAYLKLTDTERASILSHPLSIKRSTSDRTTYNPDTHCVAISDSGYDARTYYAIAVHFVREQLLPEQTDMKTNPSMQDLEQRIALIRPDNSPQSDKINAFVGALMLQQKAAFHHARSQATHALTAAAQYFLEKAPEELTPSLRDYLASNPRKPTPPQGIYVSKEDAMKTLQRESLQRDINAALKTCSSEETLDLLDRTASWLTEGTSLFQRMVTGQNDSDLESWLNTAKAILLDIKLSSQKMQCSFHGMPAMPRSLDNCVTVIEESSAMMANCATKHSWSVAASYLLQRLSEGCSALVATERKIAEKFKSLKTELEATDLSGTALSPAEQERYLNDRRKEHLTTLLRSPSHKVGENPAMHLIAFDLA